MKNKKQQYEDDVRLGKIGEKSFKKFANIVTNGFTLGLGDPKAIEGWDNGRLFVYLDSMTGAYKRIEVKTIRSFLGRDNDGDDPTGTIPFEMWNRGQDFYGWLYAMTHPNEYNDMQAERRMEHTEEEEKYYPPAVKPDLLVYALADQEDKIFCFICFNFDELIDRLEKIETRWSIKNWSLPKVKTRNYKGMIGNMWHVSFQKLQDLARVTMIDITNTVPNKLREKHGETEEDREKRAEENLLLQHTRLEYLDNLAKSEKGGGRLSDTILEGVSLVSGDQLEELKQEKEIYIKGQKVFFQHEGRWYYFEADEAYIQYEERSDTSKI